MGAMTMQEGHLKVGGSTYSCSIMQNRLLRLLVPEHPGHHKRHSPGGT